MAADIRTVSAREKGSLRITGIGAIVTWNSGSGSMEILRDRDILIGADKILGIGRFEDKDAELSFDAGGRILTAGLIDPHTHPVFAETREQEFEMRIRGLSYLEIAAAGGGIRNSVRKLRQMSEDELFERSLKRVRRFVDYGSTTIEAKSGYGLSVEDELKSLRVIRRLNEELELDLVPTFMGAHEIPDEYRDQRDAYVDLVCSEMIPAVAEQGLAEYCDVFAEPSVFLRDETEKIFRAAQDRGLKLRVHADEFESIGVTELAVSMGASSADHLLAVTDSGIEALKRGSTTATLLPGTAFFLGHSHYAPARRLWDEGISVALASDFNPGSSMTQNLQLIMTLACTQMKLTPMEALQAVTVNAARALDRSHLIGSVEPGMQADLLLWDVDDIRQIAYWYGMNHVYAVFKKGKLIHRA